MGDLRKAAILSYFVYILCTSLADGGSGERSLYRKKRYVVFPEGSSFSIALCMTVHTLTPDNIFTEGLNWGISYDLPNESKPALEPFLELRKDRVKPMKYDRFQDNGNYLKQSTGWNYDQKYYNPHIYSSNANIKYYRPDPNYVRRRHRRDLYHKLEIIMNAMNFDGRTCILRALCEAAQRLVPKGNTLIEEMIRIAFTLPLAKVFSFEPEEHRTYSSAHKAGHEGRNCVAVFSGCRFSLIDLALGKYSTNDVTQTSAKEEYNVAPHQKKSASEFNDFSQSENPSMERSDTTSGASNFVGYNMK